MLLLLCFFSKYVTTLPPVHFASVNHQESDAMILVVVSKKCKNANEKPIQVSKKNKKSKDMKITNYYHSKSKSPFLFMCMKKWKMSFITYFLAI